MYPPIPFQLWTMEQEGEVDTSEGRLNRMRLAAQGCTDPDQIRDLAIAAGFPYYEIEDIVQKILDE